VGRITVATSKRISEAFRIDDAGKFRLAEVDAEETGGLTSKEESKASLEKATSRMQELQEMLYAQDRWALLVIFQAMDAAGKDSTIKQVMSGVNPQGCEVYSFKAPSDEELDHDYMWRATKRIPERGRIGIFNRSYYEEVLVVRVHPELLDKEKIPARLRSEEIWKQRFSDMNAMERYLTRNGIAILKFFLHITADEQKKRFLERLDEPAKNWKFSVNDVRERQYWGDYMRAYEDMVRNTSTEYAPWHVIPANKKWFARLAVADAIVSALEDMNLHFPEVEPQKREELKAVRAALETENFRG
jgi:PPK2 family polyphosphate:nucleotide phosphotransferase